MFLRIIFIILVRVAWRIVIIQANFGDLEVSSRNSNLIIHQLFISIKNRCGGTFPVWLMIRVVDHHSPRFILVLKVPSLLTSHFLCCPNYRRSSSTRDEARLQCGGEIVCKSLFRIEQDILIIVISTQLMPHEIELTLHFKIEIYISSQTRLDQTLLKLHFNNINVKYSQEYTHKIEQFGKHKCEEHLNEK